MFFFELGHFVHNLLLEAKEIGQVREADGVLGCVDGLLAEHISLRFFKEKFDQVLLEEVVEFDDGGCSQTSTRAR